MEIHHVEGTEEQIHVQGPDGQVEQVQVQTADDQVNKLKQTNYNPI